MEGYHSLPFTLPTFLFISVTKKAAKVDLYKGTNKIVHHMALYFPFRSVGSHRCEVTDVLKPRLYIKCLRISDSSTFQIS